MVKPAILPCLANFVRNFSLPLLLLFLTIFVSSCHETEIKGLQEQNDSLVERQLQHDEVIRELVKTFVAIDSNMRAIHGKELHINRQIKQETVNKQERDSILLYVREIDTLTASNKALVKKLEEWLDGRSLQVSGIKQMVGSLHEKNRHKKEELNELKGKLTTIHKDFRELFEEYVITEAHKMELNERNTELDERNTVLKERNEKLLQELNTAWYAVGTKTELKEKGLIDSKGVLSEMFANQNMSRTLDKNLFNEIDIRVFNVLELNVKKAKLISPHPPGSFVIKGDKKKAEKLIINQPEEFWKLSKYLLIEIEP